MSVIWLGVGLLAGFVLGMAVSLFILVGTGGTHGRG